MSETCVVTWCKKDQHASRLAFLKFCVEHDSQWAESPEAGRAVWGARHGLGYVGSMLADFTRRISLEQAP